MQDPPTTPAHEVAAVQTVGGVLTDLVEVAERLPVPPDQAEPVARILDRLSQEITQAAAMLRGGPAAAFPPWRTDPRVTRARGLLGEHHQPLVMTPGDIRHLLARFQRAAAELLDVIDGQR